MSQCTNQLLKGYQKDENTGILKLFSLTIFEKLVSGGSAEKRKVKWTEHKGRSSPAVTFMMFTHRRTPEAGVSIKSYLTSYFVLLIHVMS